MRFLVLTFILIGIAVAFVTASDFDEPQYRTKRGIASFFRRIWPIRKHKNQNTETMMESSSIPVAAIQYPYTDYASYQQMFNQPFYQNAEFSNQYQQAAQSPMNSQYNYQDLLQQQQQQQQHQHQHQQQQQQQQQQSQAQYQSQDQQMMSQAHLQQSNAQQSPNVQDNNQDDQSGQQGNYMEESVPHPSVYARPASVYQDDRNQFHARPYGNSPGTIDVHQVLDQFIRQSGLSPQGDHENSASASDMKPVFSMKKLYSYPFYLSSSGNKPTSHAGFGKR